MSDKTIHDLAIAYAHAKLLEYQQEHPDESGTDEELAMFVRKYNYASTQIPIENENADEGF